MVKEMGKGSLLSRFLPKGKYCRMNWIAIMKMRKMKCREVMWIRCREVMWISPSLIRLSAKQNSQTMKKVWKVSSILALKMREWKVD